MKPSIIVWDLETVPDLAGFAAANDLVGKTDADIRAERKRSKVNPLQIDLEEAIAASAGNGGGCSTTQTVTSKPRIVTA
jgi:hypothetical protein